MSRDIAATENGSLIGTMLGELAKTKVYKPTQGRIVRQLTALAIWVIVGLGCWSLHGTLRGSGWFAESNEWLIPGISVGLLFFGAWFGLIVVCFFIWYINTYQIQPEEEALQKLFGDQFTEYSKKVRRWF